jgi:hypothetical protein
MNRNSRLFEEPGHCSGERQEAKGDGPLPLGDVVRDRGPAQDGSKYC